MRKILLAAGFAASLPAQAAFEWTAYGGDGRGQRHAPLAQITPANVGRLELAWTFRTGELGEGFARAKDALTFEATPLMVGGTLFFDTATGKAFALDAATGQLRWQFDAKVPRDFDYSEMASRGVSWWRDAQADAAAACAERILFATIDARLIALDARTGAACADFGTKGEVVLSKGVRQSQWRLGQYEVTSPPAIAGDVAVVGSAIGDNAGTDLELGVVRAFDLRSGRELWHWDPIPRTARMPADAANPEFGELDAQQARWTGAANAWAPLAVDAQRGLVFVPTGSPSPDFFGGVRPGDTQWANSVVALRAATGEFVWGRQLVHHDLWDYDVASQPMLVDLERDGRTIPALVQLHKTGQVFVLDRETGEPVFPIEERPVPQDVVEGEIPSPTQPFSTLPPLVSHAPVKPEDAWGLTFWDRNACRERIAALKSEGIYTPPSLAGTIERPGYAGGSNWGGGAWDPARHLLVANVMELPFVVALVPRAEFVPQYESGRYEGWEFASQRGTPYGMRRTLLKSPLGAPCIAPPWGKLVAVDLAKGTIAWSKPLGTSRDRAPWPFWDIQGAPNIGGPLTTAGGLTFVGATTDNYLRAFDTATGAEVWTMRLPAGAQATPMSYEAGGRQYVVVAAGGHAKFGTTRGDYVLAFALARER
ncbi:pyrroloquinoline quinone-dependent dehydrogenase [Dokdonella fugitiva]|jgi:quinoprotein glucose dehydrogenase|uniref:pyrroloquinoline quinone-dependent dehydrogenase n=1 Tax=Dokdonella fugitiva TaxID=328517 RepID=UPI0015F84EF8|nr:pyrroloquinoline quinone-dependent dehydrogenase [Dokdonella fugitiva]MBA8884875.1 quinoprotein glucose dehydrogenase [Dokdonella fugitiva]